MSTSEQPQYDESSVQVLKGLEPVKLRPGQFTRTDCPLHIVQEVLDNATDEAIGGYAKSISVELLPDGFIRISDDGRGIPVGIHPTEGIPTVQAVFGVLYSGGKFNKASGGAYSYSGGLHGVGVSVTNALSLSLVAEIKREGALWRIGFAEGDLVEPLVRVKKDTGHGTTITLKPNPFYFDSPDVPADSLRELLRSKAVLLPGLQATFVDARQGLDNKKEEVFFYENGLPSYLTEVAGGQNLIPPIEGSAYAEDNDPTFAKGEGASWAFAWFENGDGSGQSFVNLIPTPEGGTHVAGMRAAIFNTLKMYIEHHALLPKGVKLSADDAFKSVRFVLSAKLLDPSFDNQTKDRLNSRDGLKLVERMMQPQLEAWVSHYPAQAKVIADIVIKNALSRQKASTKIEKRKTSSVVMLPGKLSDCESEDIAVTELFLVEGDSAGGSAKQGRNKEFQAIMAMRGKGLNVWEKTQQESLSNTEISDISAAIGIPLHTRKDEVDFSKLRYGKICILADADVDGFHIQTLLLTLFFKHFPQLLDRGHIYVARPPLYRVDAEGSGKKRPAKKIYAMDEGELKSWEDRLKKEGYPTWKVGRFKGLGEMNPGELWETTLCPDTRRLLKAELPEDAYAEAIETFDNLMNKSKASWRREWMEQHGNEATS